MWTQGSGGGCGATGLLYRTPVATAAVTATNEVATWHLCEVAVPHPWLPTPCAEHASGNSDALSLPMWDATSYASIWFYLL